MARAHHQVRCEQGIIHLTLSGSFSEKDVKSYVTEMKKTISELDGKPFSILVNNLELIGATPAAYAASNEYNEWLSQQNIIANAAVYPNSLLSHLDKKWVSSKQKYRYETFQNLDLAKQWLMEMLTRSSNETSNE